MKVKPFLRLGIKGRHTIFVLSTVRKNLEKSPRDTFKKERRNPMNKFRYLTLLLFLLALSFALVFSHGKERHGKKDSVKVLQSDSSVAQIEPYRIDLKITLFEHIHNKIIHFPIAFVVAGLIFTLLGFKRREILNLVSVLVFLAGLFGILAYLTGVSQGSAFENTSKEWVVETHRNLGIATVISIWVWFLFLSVKKLKKISWVIGVIALILVLIAGFYGGILAHG